MLLLLNNERGDNKCLSIGELLKEKQQQGNEVYMQIFDFNIYQDIHYIKHDYWCPNFYYIGVKVVILIWDHDKREAPSMTPSNDTIDYFSSINIPCVAAQRNAVEGMKNSENHYRHNQRLTVMDEPIICTNQVVYLDDDINLIFFTLVFES